MDDTQRLLAYEEIRQLASRYALAIDSRDLDDLVALFVEDVRVGRDVVGRDALRRNFDDQLRNIGVSFLQTGNHVIELVDEGHATGFVYCRAEIQDGERWLVQAIGYDDTYERRDGHWLFVRRRHQLWYGAYQDQNPLTLPPANWPASQVGRGTLPQAWQSWQRFWDQG